MNNDKSNFGHNTFLHPAVASALNAAQASLASADTLYSRQLEALREVAGKSRLKLIGIKERAELNARRAPGGSPSPPLTLSFPPLLTKRPTGEGGVIPGSLSFQKALDIVRRERGGVAL